MQLTNIETIQKFTLAGNATVTLVSEKTGNRFTFKVRQSKPNADGSQVHFVGVLTGSDNTSNYSYLGILSQNQFRRTAKSAIGADAPSAKAAEWAFNRILQGVLPQGLQVWHEGKCGRCGRKLTVPSSIESGIGPECAGKL